MMQMGLFFRRSPAHRFLAVLLAIALMAQFSAPVPAFAGAEFGNIELPGGDLPGLKPPGGISGVPVLHAPVSPTLATDITVSGQAVAGAAVTIYTTQDGTTLDTNTVVTADAETGAFSAAISQLSLGTYGFYAVSQVDGVNSLNSNTVTVEIVTELPAPTNLQASAVTDTAVTLTWEYQGVASFAVKRDGAAVGIVSETTFADTQLTAETTYDYTVDVVEEGGTSPAASLTVTTTPVAPVLDPLQSPTNQTAINVTGSAAAGATVTLSYSRDGAAAVAAGSATATPAGRYTLAVDLPGAGQYSLTATTSVGGNTSPASDPVSLLVDLTPPAAPANAAATVLSPWAVYLSWTAPVDTDLHGYRITRNDAVIASPADLTASATTFIDTGLVAGSAYDYAIIAVDTAGNDSNSPATPPQVLTLPAPDPTVAPVRVSRSDQTGVAGYADSNGPAISGNGAVVAFASQAANLTSAKGNGKDQIYVHKWQSGTTELISAGPAGLGNLQSIDPAVSSDGGVVAFTSLASDLGPADDNGQWDVYVRDRTAVTTVRASRTLDGVETDGPSQNPVISGNGSIVAFDSTAANLVTGDSNGASDVFIFDVVAGTVQRISIGVDGEANGASTWPAVSDNGCAVAFASAAGNLITPGASDGISRVYLADRCGGGVQLVSRAPAETPGADGAPADAQTGYPVISGDGSVIAFWSQAGNLGGPAGINAGLYVYEVATGSMELVSLRPDASPVHSVDPDFALSRDGRHVAFTAYDDGGKRQVYLYDRAAGTTVLVSAQADGTVGNGDSDDVALSGPGTGGEPLVAFASLATNLVSGDVEGRQDVFLTAPALLPADATPPQWPADAALTAAAGTITPTWVQLEWPAASDAVRVDRYHLYQGDTLLAALRPGQGSLLTRPDGSLAFTLTGLTPDTEYPLSVAAVDPAGNTSVRLTAAVRTAVLQPPGTLTWTATETDVTLSWTAPTDAASYRVVRDGTVIATVTETTHTDAGLESGTYSYEVVALTADSHASEPTTVTAATRPVVRTFRVSQTGDGTEADGNSSEAAYSGNGRYVVFASTAANLTATPFTGSGLFVRDLITDAVAFVAPGSQPDISADGRYVAFTSGADGLTANDDNGQWDVFVYDRQTSTTVRISRSAAGGASQEPSISGDGRFVVFQSVGDDLTADDGNGQEDVFLHDRDSDGNGTFDEAGGTTTVRVSRSHDGQPETGSSFEPAISADGGYVAFSAVADNLVSGDVNGRRDVFRYERTSGTLVRVSVTADGQPATGDSFRPALSADGRYVAFRSSADNLHATGGSGMQIYLRDMQTGSTELISLTPAGQPGNDVSQGATIGGGGRWVAFASSASDLVSTDHNIRSDIFVRDRLAGRTYRVNLAEDGSEANGVSLDPSLRADGRGVVYTSSASNLVANDANGDTDLFVSLWGPDVDTEPPVWPNFALTAGEATHSSVGLTWTMAQDNKGIMQYAIYEQTNQGLVLRLTVPGTTQSVTVDGLTVGTNYTFAVAAGDAIGNWSTGPQTVAIATLSFAELDATPHPGGEVELMWSALPEDTDATVYRIYRQEGNAQPVLLDNVSGLDSLLYRDTGLPAETTYTYTVYRLDSAGAEGTHTAPVPVTTPKLAADRVLWSGEHVPFKYTLLLPEATLTIRLTAEPNRQAASTVTYSSWHDDDGNLLDATVTRTSAPIPLAAGAQPGQYVGNWDLPPGAAGVSVVTAVLTDGAGHSAEVSSYRNNSVAGSLAVTVSAPAADVDALNGARLVVQSESGGLGATQLNGEGTYILADLLPDDYEVRILYRATDGSMVTLAEQQGITVQAGKQTVHALSASTRPAFVRVKVKDVRNNAVSRATILVEDAGGGAFQVQTRTDMTGSTERISGWVGGDRVRAVITGVTWPLVSGDETNLDLQVGDNLITLTAADAPRGTLSGIITNAAGQPAPGIEVTVIQRNPDQPRQSLTARAQTGSDGRYSVDVVAGTVEISAGSRVGDFVPQTGAANVPAGGSATWDVQLPSERLPATVDVRLETRYPGSDWEAVTLADWRNAIHFRLRVTNDLGHSWGHSPIRLLGLPGDTFRACADGVEAGLPAVCEEVQLDAQRHAEVTLRMEAQQMVRARTVDAATGDPMSYPMVNLFAVAADGTRSLVAGKMASLGGEVSFAPADPGTYQIEAQSPFGNQRTGQSQVFGLSPGDDRAVEIALLAAGWFGGQPGNSLTTAIRPVTPGSRVQATATYHNAGTAVATGAKLRLQVSGGALVSPHANLAVDGTTETRSVGMGNRVDLGDLAPGTEGRVTFTVLTGSELTDIGLTAYLEYQTPDGAQEEILGTAAILSRPITMDVPERLAALTTQVSGRAIPDATVRVYDGTVLLGQTQATPGGYWSLTVTLPDTGELQTHPLRAEVQTDSGPVSTELIPVRYFSQAPRLQRITMSNGGRNPVTWDPSSGVHRFPFVLNPDDPLLFELDFNYPEAVTDVRVVVAGLGEVSAHRGSDDMYRAAVALADQSPGDIYVRYQLKPKYQYLRYYVQSLEELRTRWPQWMEGAETVQTPASAQEVPVAVLVPADPALGWLDTSLERQDDHLLQRLRAAQNGEVLDSGTTTFAVPGLGGTGTAQARFETGQSHDPSQTVASNHSVSLWREGTGYVEMEIYDLQWSYYVRQRGDGKVDVDYNVSAFIPESTLQQLASDSGLSELLAAALKEAKTGGTANLLRNASEPRLRAASGLSQGAKAIINWGLIAIDGTNNLVSAMGPKEKLEHLNNLKQQATANCPAPVAQHLHEWADDIAEKLMWGESMKWTFNLAAGALGATGVGLLGGAVLFGVSLGIGAIVDHEVDDHIETLAKSMADNCEPDEEDPDRPRDPRRPRDPNDPDDPGAPVGSPGWIWDPSGYVYEAVESNRLSGVTATALNKDPGTGAWEIWDATWYGQVNPHDTDDVGKYGWDVPAGNWQVMYQRTGFETAYSAVLTVPPPHFDVNVGLRSLLPSTVTSVTASPGGTAVTVTFSKYMLTSTVTTTTLQVAPVGGGSAVTGTVTAVDAATDSDGNSVATSFRLMPDTALTPGASYTVTVSQLVQSYAGVPMAADDVRSLTIAADPPLDVADATATAGDGSLQLGWTDPADPDLVEVRLYQRIAGAGSFGDPITVAVGAGSYTLVNLFNGAEYDLKIATFDSFGNESAGVTLSGTPAVPPPPPVPGTPPPDGGGISGGGTPPPPPVQDPVVGLGAIARNETIRLTWTDPDNDRLAEVRIEWRPDGAGAWEASETVAPGVQSHTITGLQNGTPYLVRVTALDSDGIASQPLQFSVIPVDRKPPAQVTDAAAAPGNGSLTVSWTDPDDADLAVLELVWWPDADPDMAAVVEVAPGTGQYSLTGLENGMEYVVRLVTVDAAGNSAPAILLRAAPVATDADSQTGAPSDPAVNDDTDPTSDPADSGERLKVSPGEPVTALDGAVRLTGMTENAGSTAQTVVTVTRVLAPDAPGRNTLVPAGPTIDLAMESVPEAAAQPLRLTISFDGSAARSADEDLRKLGLYRRDADDPTGWVYVGGVIDLEGGTLTARVSDPGTYAVMTDVRSFGDLQEHWSRSEVEVLMSRHLVDGVGAGRFDPDRPITRAEVTKLLVMLLQRDPDGSGAAPGASAGTDSAFVDVARSAWYHPYVQTAARHSLVQGYDGRFRPDAPVTREELATLLIRAMGLQQRAEEVGTELPFSDAAALSGWARGSAAVAYELGLMRGVSEATFAPSAPATRAQAAVVLLRAMEQLGWVIAPAD